MIYYDDGSRFTNEDGDIFDAPRLGVQIIAYKHETLGWELVSQSDYFYFEPEARGFYMADYWTVRDVLVRSKHPLIFFGRMVSDESFRQICLRMLDELPTPKTAWRRGRPSWLEGV